MPSPTSEIIARAVRTDHEIAFRLSLFENEADAIEVARLNDDAGFLNTYNGGLYDGQKRGREPWRDVKREDGSTLYAVTW